MSFTADGYRAMLRRLLEMSLSWWTIATDMGALDRAARCEGVGAVEGHIDVGM